MAEKLTTDPTDATAWHARFLTALATTGIVSRAAKAAKVGRSTAYRHRGDDAEFARLWDDAVEESNDLLEAEAFRRAVKGVRKPVYQGKLLVGYVREYSDQLLITLLKSRRPSKYRDGVKVVVAGDPTAPLPIQADLNHTAAPSVFDRIKRWEEIYEALHNVAPPPGTAEALAATFPDVSLTDRDIEYTRQIERLTGSFEKAAAREEG